MYRTSSAKTKLRRNISLLALPPNATVLTAAHYLIARSHWSSFLDRFEGFIDRDDTFLLPIILMMIFHFDAFARSIISLTFKHAAHNKACIAFSLFF
jgi:hypothetical protein